LFYDHHEGLVEHLLLQHDFDRGPGQCLHALLSHLLRLQMLIRVRAGMREVLTVLVVEGLNSLAHLHQFHGVRKSRGAVSLERKLSDRGLACEFVAHEVICH